MLTMPSRYNELRGRRTGGEAWIVRLDTTTSGEEIYFSTKPITLSSDSIVCNALLVSVNGIAHAYDPRSCKYQPSAIIMQFSAVHDRVRPTTGTQRERLGDYLEDAYGQDVTIYIFPGGSVVSLTDCLVVFKGRVDRMQYDSDTTIRVYADERNTVLHRDLPQRTFDVATFSDLPASAIGKTMPIVYGDYHEDLYLRSSGFVFCEPIGKNKWLVADHKLDLTGEIGWMFIKQLESWASIESGQTVNEDDDGRGTLSLTDQFTFDAHLFPFQGAVTSTGTDGSNDVGPNAAFDADVDTKVSVIAHSTTSAAVEFEWNQQGDPSDDSVENGIGVMQSAGCGVQVYRSVPGGITVTAFGIDIFNTATSTWVSLGTASTVDSLFFTNFDNFGWLVGSNRVVWHLAHGMLGGDGTGVKIRFTFTGTGWTADTTVVAYIHEARIQLRGKFWSYPHRIYRGKQPREGNVPRGILQRDGTRTIDGDRFEGPTVISTPWALPEVGNDRIAMECVGREYGAWIDEAGRSNSFNEGQNINTAQYAIESLLRDELGLVAADLDVDSFDISGHTTFTNIALGAGSRINSKRLIESICFEEGFILYRRQNGEMRLMDLIAGTGATTVTLTADDLGGKMPVIWKTPLSRLRNRLIVNYRKLPHDGSFAKTFTVNDTTSQTDFTNTVALVEEIDIVTKNFESGITSPSSGIDKRFISSSHLLSRDLIFVRLETVGIKWAHIELGDSFALDETSFGHQMRLYGATWTGVTLIVYSKTTRIDATIFDCIIWS